MRYPSFDQYQVSLQSPETSFRVSQLKAGEVQLDLWGLPQVRSGGFALTYKVNTKQDSYAVRCFHKDVVDRARRYSEISRFILEQPNPYFIPITYHHKGILVFNKLYPLTIMKWIDGETLESYINKNHRNQALMERLLLQFIELINSLHNVGIAHGDLSTQNILIYDSKLILVDYDGMFIPNLSGLLSNETGHANYQHPGRDFTWFNPGMDDFSTITIALALKSLIIHPDLWEKYEGSGEGFLLRKQDFLLPYQSPLLQEIETFASLREYVYIFRKICHAPISCVPRLSDFIEKRVNNLPKDETQIQSNQIYNNIMAVNSSRRLMMMNQLGKIVTVVGKVTDVFEGKTRDGKDHVFLNFGNWKGKCFTVVIWSEAYLELKKAGRDPKQFLDKWISSTGLLTSYKNRPQIAFASLMGFEVLQDEEEAAQRLGSLISNTSDSPGSSLIGMNSTFNNPDNENRGRISENGLNNSSDVSEQKKRIKSTTRINLYNESFQKRINELFSGSPEIKD